MTIKKTTRTKTDRLFFIIICFAVVLAAAFGGAAKTRAQSVTTSSVTLASSTSAQSLQDQINQKSKALTAINQQILTAKATLFTTQSQRVTLQQQLSLINGTINTLNLGIQADNLTTQQLTLEIQQLGSNIQDIGSSVAVKQQAIASLLKSIQASDAAGQNPLIILLRNGTLADSVMEAQTTHNLQVQLAEDIDALKNLQTRYTQSIQSSTEKKQSIVAHEEDLQNKRTIVQDQQNQKQTLLASTKNQESVFQKQLTALQQEQQDINSQLEAIDAVLRTKIDPSTLPALGPGVLLVPVQGDDKADVTQGYGATAFARHEYVHHWHNGLDFAASIGTPILAADDGTVAAAANEDLYCPHGAYGKFVVINHNNNLTTLYGHLSKILVTSGQAVKRGDVVGYSGNTGDVTGPHLHFTVFARPTYYLESSKSCGPLPEGGDLDPAGYLF